MSRVGLFGGSFDPIHNGHLITSIAVREIRKLDKVIFIPCYISPHKLAGSHSSAEHRLNLVRTAVSEYPFFVVSDFEIIRGEVSYSIDTVRHFKQFYDEIDLIIGYDNLMVFESWKEPDELIKLAELVVLRRQSDNLDGTNRFFDIANFVETPFVDISSTEIRARINKGKPVESFIPENVLKYIIKNNLYK